MQMGTGLRPLRLDLAKAASSHSGLALPLQLGVAPPPADDPQPHIRTRRRHEPHQTAPFAIAVDHPFRLHQRVMSRTILLISTLL